MAGVRLCGELKLRLLLGCDENCSCGCCSAVWRIVAVAGAWL